MSKRRDDVKRQLFKGLSTQGTALDSSTSNLLSRTLRKESDKYRRPLPGDLTLEEQQFIIHKSTSPDDYKIFSSDHPLRDSRLQALSQAETALDELFRRNGADDSGSEDDEPDLSNIAPSSEINRDDILISVPGYSREEVTASKRLAINERKNARISRVSSLERGFSNTDFLKQFTHSRIQEYKAMNEEYIADSDKLKSDIKRRRDQEEQIMETHPDDKESEAKLNQIRMELIRETVTGLESDSWRYQTPEYLRQ